jgi:hypothetical protein
MDPPMTWRRWPILVTALGLLFAACGGGDGAEGIASLQEDTAAADGSTTTAHAAAVDPEQAMLDFTQCMRDHGVDMPDPEVNTAGGGFSFGITIQGGPGDEGAPDNTEMQQMQEANAACQHFLEGMVQQFERPDMSEMQDQMLAFAQCMRDHGVDMPDPEFSDDGGVTAFGSGEGGEGFAIDPNDPTFQAAQEACQEIFGGQDGVMTITGGGPGAGVIVAPGGGEAPNPGTGDSSGGG